MKKIVVFGLPGAGKSTLANMLATRLGVAHYDLDRTLFSGPGGKALPLEEFRAAVAAITCGDAWVVEGNYSKLADVTWDRADVVVWLDYPLPLLLWRGAKRSVRRLAGREPRRGLTFRRAFVGSRSVLGNTVRKYLRNRDKYRQQLDESRARGVDVVRFRRPRETDAWVSDYVV